MLGHNNKKIKVLVVDDSALIRMLLTKALSNSEELEVVGSAEDPIIAMDMIKQLNPDVLTLDVEMPNMDGITFLKNLMRLRPMPVIMISALTREGASVTLKALEYGAIDFIAKPDSNMRENLLAYSTIIIEKVISASKAQMNHFVRASGASVTIHESALEKHSPTVRTSIELITIGASTGGTEAIKSVIMNLPTNLPPIVIAQHIPPVFSTSFAKRLNESCALTVTEPSQSMQLESGYAYLAPGGEHMRVIKKNGSLFLNLDTTEPVNRHRPSVEVLFDSVNKAVGQNALGVILTGMGADGAEALKRLKDEGAHTIVQDEASSVVWGMPGATVKIGGATEILSLTQIASRLISLVQDK